MKVSRPPVMYLLAAYLPVSACGPTPAHGPAHHRVDTLANGALRVTNSGDALWAPSQAWTTVEDLRIGRVNGSGPDRFGFIGPIAVDLEGRILVADALANDVRVFHGDGTFSHSFGGEGQGPGQLSGITGMTLDPRGTVIINEGRNLRFSVFASDGSFIATYPRNYFSRLRPWPGRVIPGLGLVDWAVELPWDDSYPGGSRLVFRPLGLGPDLASRDSFPAIEFDMPFTAGNAPRPFSGTIRLNVDRHGDIWFFNTRRYEIFRRTLSGDTTLVFSLPHEPAIVTPEERSALVREWIAPRRIDPSDVYDTKWSLHQVVVDDAGHVLAFPDPEDPERATRLDVFDTAGVFQGTVTLATPLWILNRQPVATGGFLYGVTTDDLDVQYVVRLRLGANVVAGSL